MKLTRFSHEVSGAQQRRYQILRSAHGAECTTPNGSSLIYVRLAVPSMGRRYAGRRREMGLHLSSTKIAQLQAATAILLSPFAASDGDEWRRAVCAAIEPIVDSRGSMFGLAMPDETLLIGNADVVAAMQPFMPPTGWMLDSWLKAVLRGEKIIAWRDVYEPTLLKRTDFYNDVVRPNR